MKPEEAITKLEARIRDLRLEYERFFKGELRRAPYDERLKIRRAIDSLQTTHVTNTQVRFKVQTIANQFTSLSNYWDRTMIQIEAGKYQPDRFKAELHSRERRVTRPAEDATAATPVERKEPADADTRELYRQFLECRRVTGENTSVAFETFKASIDKQRPALEAKFGKQVRLKIAIEDGKTKVKGITK